MKAFLLFWSKNASFAFVFFVEYFVKVQIWKNILFKFWSKYLLSVSLSSTPLSPKIYLIYYDHATFFYYNLQHLFFNVDYYFCTFFCFVLDTLWAFLYRVLQRLLHLATCPGPGHVWPGSLKFLALVNYNLARVH